MRTEVVTSRLLDPEALLINKLKLQLGHQVGDLGCGGAGYFTLPAARIVGSKGKVYAVDVLKSALDGVMSKAKLENAVNIEYIWSDLERLGATKIMPATLDDALLVNILFQSRKNSEILKEACRLLKSGGKLLLVDWKVEPTPFGPPLEVRLAPETVESLAAGAGFSCTERFEAGPYHYGFIYTKV